MDELNEILSRSDTIDIYFNPLVALWMREKAKRDPVAFCRLIQDNAIRFERIMGAGVKVRWARGEGLAWEIEELGVPLVVVTSDRGTIFLLNYPGGERAFASDRKMGSALTALLERMLLSLSGFGSGNKA